MTDEQIIALFNERSEKAIQELDLKYGRLLRKLSHNILNNEEDAAECVNDAYFGAWNGIPPAKPDPLLTYPCKIVRNTSLKVYHRNQALKRNSGYEVALKELETSLASFDTVESEIEAKELTRIIETFLDTLSKENRIIFLRRYWFSDSYKDISERTGLTEKNISVRLSRIRQKLKEYLQESEVYL